MSGNIFRQACLVQLSTSCWQGCKALEPSILESRFGESEWLSGRKYLVSPESLAPIKAVVGRARKFMERNALPFPIKGLTLVPKEMLSRVDAGLDRIRAEFFDEVESFIGKYADERLAAQVNLGELFSESDYPLDIEGKFRFEWRFLTLDVPGKSGVLPPEVYEREKEKFQAMMEETRQIAVAALREEFSQILHHMIERLSGEGKPKRFKSSMVEKMQHFLGCFDDRNLFHDESLSELVGKAREIISGVSPESLRDSDQLRSRISAEMGQLKESLDRALEDLPRRKIRLTA